MVDEFESLSTVGIGHTRWATHGRPSAFNAHPHGDCNQTLMVAHNGIIENFMHLRKQLMSEGHKLLSETDSEVLAHLIEKNYKGDLKLSLIDSLMAVEGAYAMSVVHKDHPDKILCARKDAPLLIGLGSGENFVASANRDTSIYTQSCILIIMKGYR